MRRRSNGFTLIEMLAIIIVLGILTATVLPSVFSMVRKARENSYDVLMTSYENSAKIYIARNLEEVEENLDTYNYYTLTLDDLMSENLLKDSSLTDPRTDERIALSKKIIITRKTDLTLDVCFEDRVCYIPTLLVNELTDESNIVSGTTEGLHHDVTNDYYYYRGGYPKNWIEFNGYLWRIVRINSDGSLKIIFEGTKNPNGTVQNGTTGLSVFNTSSTNDYNTALTIKNTLQNWYSSNITAANQSKVKTQKWCIGKTTYSSAGVPKATFATNECSTLTTDSLASGMITGKEYLYASLDELCTKSYSSSDTNTLTCKNKNYLYKNDYTYWTISGDTNLSNAWSIDKNGSLGPVTNVTTSVNVRPVITLINGLIIDKGDGSFENPYTLKEIVNEDTEKPVITLLGNATVNMYVGETYTDAGATATDNVNGDLTSKIIVVSNLNTNEPGRYTITYTVSDISGNKKSIARIVNVLSTAVANAPVLNSGMTPIKWDGTEWKETTKSDSDWYSYTETNKKWANAKTADGSMWVWIPRYVYRISSGWHTNTAGTIDIQFSKGVDDNWNNSVIGDIVLDGSANASNAATNGNRYTNHPAFKFGDTELSGIWVAKFEPTAAEGVANGYTSDGSCPVVGDDVTTKTVKILPNVASWRCIKLGNAFTTIRNMETSSAYGWATASGLQANGTFTTDSNGIDTHLMKNTEWGAVAYLSKSSYGKNTEEIYVNNNRNYITGCAGSQASAAGYDGCQYSYESTGGVKASTTGNIYGIYDLSGCAWERVSAYLNNGNSSLNTYGSTIVDADAKYKNIYTVGSTDDQANNYPLTINFKGDALYETSNNINGSYSWFGDYSYMIYSSYPWFRRGGYWSGGSWVGAFAFFRTNGNPYSEYGFRPVLLVNAGI